MYNEITAGFQRVVFHMLGCLVEEAHSQEHSLI